MPKISFNILITERISMMFKISSNKNQGPEIYSLPSKRNGEINVLIDTTIDSNIWCCFLSWTEGTSTATE